MKQGETTNDQANYRKMSEPFDSKEAANDALEKFFADISESRKRHGVANVIVIIKDSCLYDGEGGDFMNVMQFGDSNEHEAMAAYAFGQIKAEHTERINRILTKAIKDGGK